MRLIDIILALLPLAVALACLLGIRAVKRWQERRARQWMEPALNRLGFLMVPPLPHEHTYDRAPRWPCSKCGALHGRGLHQRCAVCR